MLSGITVFSISPEKQTIQPFLDKPSHVTLLLFSQKERMTFSNTHKSKKEQEKCNDILRIFSYQLPHTSSEFSAIAA